MALSAHVVMDATKQPMDGNSAKLVPDHLDISPVVLELVICVARAFRGLGKRKAWVQRAMPSSRVNTNMVGIPLPSSARRHTSHPLRGRNRSGTVLGDERPHPHLSSGIGLTWLPRP